MEKIAPSGSKLTKAEQKKILGGGAILYHPASVDCFDGNIINLQCPLDYHAISNTEQGSVKCCHYTIDCCYTLVCFAPSLTYQGSACTMLMQYQQQQMAH